MEMAKNPWDRGPPVTGAQITDWETLKYRWILIF